LSAKPLELRGLKEGLMLMRSYAKQIKVIADRMPVREKAIMQDGIDAEMRASASEQRPEVEKS
jgi:hypothetical protein